MAGERPDYEGQLSAYVHGRRVVDLWAGRGGVGAGHPVRRVLVDQGRRPSGGRPAGPGRHAGAGPQSRPTTGRSSRPRARATLTLRELLAHRAGAGRRRTPGSRCEELADDRAIAERLADQQPVLAPGTAFGYHALVIGALTGEIVRRATGRTLQEVYEERIRAPYGPGLLPGAAGGAGAPLTAPCSRWRTTAEQQAVLDAAPQVRTRWPSIAFNQPGAGAGRPGGLRPTPVPSGEGAGVGGRSRRPRAGWPGCTRRRSARWTTGRRC